MKLDLTIGCLGGVVILNSHGRMCGRSKSLLRLLSFCGLRLMIRTLPLIIYVVWNAIPACLMWLLWRERNQRAFKDAERHSADLKLILIRTLMEWTAAISSQSFPSVFAFIDGCI